MRGFSALRCVFFVALANVAFAPPLAAEDPGGRLRCTWNAPKPFCDYGGGLVICENGETEPQEYRCDIACGGTNAPVCKYYVDCDGDGYAMSTPRFVSDTCRRESRLGDCEEKRHPTDPDDPSDGRNIHPGAVEDCTDGIDNDCDDSIDGFFDRDDDGFFASYCDGENDPGEDCDDDDDRQYPGAPEICNEDDTDCDGEVDSQEDRDGDGRRWDCSDKPADCDDTNPDRYVGNEEVCETDGPPVDNSCFQVCDPSVHDCREELPRDITPNLLDWDGDGVFFDVCNPNSPDNDCNDNDFHVNPQALGDFCSDKDADCDGLKGEDYQPFDICGNGFDDDCDGKEDEGEPGLVDQCDTIDNNCVDGVDEAMDFDQDGSIHACCKDENPDDGVDDCPQGPTTYVGGTDCVDVKFNGDEPAWVRGDGRGECPNDWSAELCNLSKFIHPGQTEVCNGFDDNCNGEADEERDVDGDGELGFSCDPNKPVTDPDDTSAVCNVAPQSEDEFYEYAQYYDANGDGEPDCRTNCFNENGDDICQLDEICPMKPWEVAKGSPGSLTLYSLRNYFPTRQCAENSYTTSADENVFFEIPKTIEVSKGRCVEQWADLEFTNSQQTIRCRYNCDSDQNQYAFAWCDNGFSQNGDVVLADVVTLDNSLGDIFDAPLETRSMMIFEMRDCDPDALDKDGDLHFPPGSCYYPADDCDDDPETGGAFTDNCSCEDYAVASRPVREEVCDGHDNDCDGEIDNGVAAVYYVDRDRDGLGDDSHCFATCPFNINDAQFATVGGDCNDNADGARCSSECSDFDGDGYSSNCTEGPLDCDDSRADVFPGAPEVCDGADNDCDCRVDEDTIESQTECLAGSGPCAVAGTSICRNGALICREEAVSDYVAPMREICGDGVDNNCEGGVDEGCARADCTAGVHVAYASSACLPDSYAEAPAGLTTQGAPDPIPDSFAVNDHGAATYTLPIVVPPGIRGLQPSLSVSFNSQLRSGRRSPLGQGFTLTGVPSIERCAYQEVVDGWTSAPELNDEDAWCLGGQRLIRGDNPSTLYLHRSPFEPVEQTAWGFVWSKKDGTEWTFNNRVDVEGQTVRYRLTQVEDSYGNSISFQSYEHRLPSLIRYSGFTVSLEFEDYPSEGPPDGYFLGDRFARRRLARINVEADASGRIRSYVFEHDGQGTLQKITEEVGPSGASSTNTRSVTFDWDRWAGTDPQFTEVPRECSTCGVPAPPGGGRITIADLDGDGIPEVGPGFEIDGDDDVRLRYAKLTLDGEIIRRVDPWRNELPKDAEPHPPGCGSDDWRCQDWDDYLIEWWFDSDQDGTAEWWIGERKRDHFYIFHPDLNDTACPSGSPDAPGCKGVREVSWRWRDFTRTWMGDFDGDSVFEIITANEHGDLRTINPALNLNSGSVRALEGGIKLGEGASPTSGDFDRDGVVDVRFMSGHNVWSFTGADRKTSSREVSTYPNANERTRLVSGDYNGDGYGDIVDCDGRGRYALGTGTPGRTFGPSGPVRLDDSVEDVYCVAADYDHDGDSELWVHTEGRLLVYDFRDSGSELPGTWQTVFHFGLDAVYEPLDFVAADLDGDGDTDLYFHSFKGDWRGAHVFVNQAYTPQLVGIREHYDQDAERAATHSIDYTTVRDPSVYIASSSEGDCPSDRICFPPRVDVVRSTSHATSTDLRRRLSYLYANGERDRQGRYGGFRWRAVTEVDSKRFHTFERALPSEGVSPWLGNIVTTEHHVYAAGDSARSVVTTVRRTPALKSGEGMPDGTIFPYVSETESLIGEGASFEAERGELLGGIFVPPPWYAKTLSSQELDNYGNVVLQTSSAEYRWTGFDPGRAALEGAGSTSRVESSFDAGASTYARRRGLFDRIESSAYSTLCRAYQGGSSGMELPDAYSDCPPGASSTSVVQLDYNAQGDVRTRTVGSVGRDLTREEIGYDNRGRVTQTTLIDLTDRDAPVTTRTLYNSASSIYPSQTINALGQSSLVAYDERFGVPIFAQDVDGVATSSGYDHWGREVFVKAPTRSARVQYATGGVGGAARTVSSFVDDEVSPRSRSVLDARGRTLRSEVRLRDGTFSGQSFEYDIDGRTVRTSTPSVDGAGETYAVRYDSLGRVTRAETAIGIVENTYNGPETHRTLRDSSGTAHRSSAELRGVHGDVIAAEHGASPGTRLIYYQSASGQLMHVESRSPNRSLLTAELDSFGRVSSLAVSGLGSRRYTYSGFGEVIGEFDAAGRQVTSRSDSLGRVLARAGVNSPTSRYSYDTSSGLGGVGGLAESRTSEGLGMRVEYDSLGRVTRESYSRETPVGSASPASDYSHEVEYRFDAKGRLKRELMPNSPGVQRPALCYSYDAVDGLDKTFLELGGPLDGSPCTESEDSTELLMEVVERDAEGRVVMAQLGSGRTMSTAYSTEKYAWGSVEELRLFGGGETEFNLATGWAGGQLQTKTVAYDGVPGLDQTYVYENEQLVEVTGDEAVSYGSHGAFGVMTQTPGHGAVTRSSGFRIEETEDGEYFWDEAGYLSVGPDRSYTFDDFGRPTDIAPRSGDGWSPVRFEYDASDTRVSMDDGVDHLVRSGRYTVQKSLGGSAATQHRYDLGFALLHVPGKDGETHSLEYIVADQVGSALLRESSPGTGEMASMPPYGSVSLDTGPDADSHMMQPGFGGHLSLHAAGGLVDMNARLYDPELGMFVSPDPLLPDAYNPLSYSPYVYAFNDPGSLNDPTGEAVCGGLCVGAIVGAVAGAVAGAVTTHQTLGDEARWQDYLLNVGAGALTGAATGALGGYAVASSAQAAIVIGGGFGAVGGTGISGSIHYTQGHYVPGGGAAIDPTQPEASRSSRRRRRSGGAREQSSAGNASGRGVSNVGGEQSVPMVGALHATLEGGDAGGLCYNGICGEPGIERPLLDPIDLFGGSPRMGFNFTRGLLSRGFNFLLRRGGREGAEMAGCFPEDTLVATPYGFVPIEEIGSGDWVYCAATDSAQAQWMVCEVESLISYEHVGDVADIRADGEPITATAEHPFWVIDGDDLEFRPAAREVSAISTGFGRWVEAQDLAAGDVVVTMTGEQVILESVSLRSDRLRVFNLTVADQASFAVGEQGILVHNSLAPKAGVLFGQKSVSRVFTSAEAGSTFKYAGKSIAEVAKGLRSGAIKAGELPVQFIVHNGQRIAVNNRSLTALRRAGMQPTRLIDVTSDAVKFNRVMGRLQEMGGAASDVIRIRGAGSGASAIY